MKTLGLIGGMSWESTVTYYQQINQATKAALGGLHSAKVILFSVDFAEMEALMQRGDWDALGAKLAHAACTLEAAGADALVLCTNTMHKVAATLEHAVRIPLLHIADPTAEAAVAQGFGTVGLLGTRATMEQDFYRQRLQTRYGLTVLVPPEAERNQVHQIIFEELCLGQAKEASRQTYLRIIDDLQAQGAQAVILGCTEIGLLIKPEHCALPLLDTTLLHANYAARWALAPDTAATQP